MTSALRRWALALGFVAALAAGPALATCIPNTPCSGVCGCSGTLSCAPLGGGGSGTCTCPPSTPTDGFAYLWMNSPGQVNAGQPATLEVQACDATENLVADWTGSVTFSSTDAAAALPANYTFVVGDGGKHPFGFTLRTGPSAQVQATLSADPAVWVYSVINVLGPPASFTVTGIASPRTAGVASSMTVAVVDSFGHQLTDYTGTVHFTSSDPTAVLPADYTFTAADFGSHGFSNVVLKTAGTQSVTATATANASLTGSQSGIQVVAAAATKLLVSGIPSPFSAGTPATVSVEARDAFNNRATSYTGTVHFTSSDAAAALPADVTFTAADAGIKQVPGVALKTPGTQSVTATDTVTAAITGNQTGISVVVGPVAKFIVSGMPASVNTGTAATVTVDARDAGNNRVTGYRGTVRFTSSDPKAVLPANYTFTATDAGVHTFTNGVTLKTSGSQSVTATDTVTASVTGSQTGITVNPGAAATLAVRLAAKATVNIATDVSVDALDANGNLATGYTGTIKFSSTNTTAALPVNYTFKAADKGTHPFVGGVTFKATGSFTVTATDTVKTTIKGTSAAVTVGANTATQIITTGPPSATAGSAFSITVQALDAAGNVSTGYRGTVVFSSSDPGAVLPNPPSLSYPFTATDAGKHTFSGLALKKAGNQTVQAKDAALVANPATIAVTPAAASSLAFTSVPSSATAGTPFSATLQASDPFGNLATGYAGTIHLTSSDPARTLPADTPFPPGGVWSFQATLRTAGTQSITAVDTANAALTATASVPVSPGVVSQIVLSALPAQVAPGDSSSFTVELRDASGNRATNSSARLHFSSTDAQATLPADYTYTTTDAGLHAFAVVFQTSGAQSVTAQVVAGGTGSATASTSVVVPVSALRVSGFPSPVDAGTTGTILVEAVNGAGSRVGSYRGTVSLSSTDPAASLPAAYTFTAADAGAHSFTISLRTAGPRSVTATDGANLTGSQSIQVNPAAASSLLVTGVPSPVAACVTSSVVVDARDPFGNRATGYRGTVHFTTTDPAALLPQDYAFLAADQGVHTFSLTLRTAGTRSVTAADTVTSSITGSQSGIDVRPGAMSAFALALPARAQAGQGISVTVRAVDACGNTVPTYTGTVSFNSTDSRSALPGPIAFAAADAGSKTLSGFVFRTAGTQTLLAGDGTFTGSSTLQVDAAPAVSLVVSGFTSTFAGESHSVSVAGVDAYGNVDPTYSGTIHFTSTDPRASLPADTAIEMLAGPATVCCVVLGTVGTQSVTATDAATPPLTGALTGISVQPGAAARFVVSGFPPAVVADAPATVQVKAIDAYDNVATAYAGIVHFSSSDPQAVLAGDYGFTAADAGVHAFAGVRLRTAGTQSVRVSDIASPTITGLQDGVIVQPGPAASLRVAGLASPRSAGDASTLTVSALDAFGNVATGYAGTVQFSSSDPQAVLPAATAFTATDAGRRDFPGVVLRTAGTQSVAAADVSAPSIAGSQPGIQVTPATPSSLVASGIATPIVAGTQASLTVRVFDAFGNAATQYRGTVALSATDPAAELDAPYAFTAADAGLHAFSVRLKSAGVHAVSAADTAAPSLAASQQGIEVRSAAAARLVLSGLPAQIPAGAAGTLQVEAQDAFGNRASGYLGTVTISSTDPQASVPTPYPFTAGDGGIRSFQVVFRTPGSQTVSATDGTLSASHPPVVVQAPPEIVLTSPIDGQTVDSAAVTVAGVVVGKGGAATLTVEGRAVPLATDGSFATELSLVPGKNVIHVVATSGPGLTSEIHVTVTRVAAGSDAGVPATDGGVPGTDGGVDAGTGGNLLLSVGRPQDGAVVGGSAVVSGTAVGGVPPLHVTVDDLPIGSGPAFSASLSLFEGDRTIVVRATDSAGHVAVVQRLLHVDTTPPFLRITSPFSNPWPFAGESPFEIRGVVGDPHLDRVLVGDQVATVAGGMFSASVPLQPGSNSIVVDAIDLAGNHQSIVQEIVASNVAPSVTILEPAPGSEATSAVITVRVQVRGGGNFISRVLVGSVPAVEYSPGGLYSAQIPLELGDNTIRVTVSDALGLTGTASVGVHFGDPSTAPLAVMGVDPPLGALNVETDTLVTVTFNKPVDPATLAGNFTVSADGAPLLGGWSSSPSLQSASFVARGPLPEAKRLSVRVSGVRAQVGPGLARDFTSDFTVRNPLTRVHGSVVDVGVSALPDTLVTVEELGLSTRSGKDGAWALVLPRGGRYTLRYQGGATSDGRGFASVRRSLFAQDQSDTGDGTVVLPLIDGTSTQQADASKNVALDFNGRDPGLSISVPAGGLSFADGRTTGAVSATRLPGYAVPLPVNGTVHPAVSWLLQPLGVRFTRPVAVAMPNTVAVPPGRRALLFVADADRHELVRAGFAKVSADGASVVPDNPIETRSLEVFGYAPLTEAQSAAVEAVLGGLPVPPPPSGVAPGGSQGLLFRPTDPTWSPWELFGISEAHAQFLLPALTQQADAIVSLYANAPSFLIGRVRTPRQDGIELDLELTGASRKAVISPLADDFSAGPVTLLLRDDTGRFRLPAKMVAKAIRADSSLPTYAIAARFSATGPLGKAIAPPASEIWNATVDPANDNPDPIAATVELRYGVSKLDFDALSTTNVAHVTLTAQLDPAPASAAADGGLPADAGIQTLPDGGLADAQGNPITLATLKLDKVLDTRDVTAPLGIPFKGVRVSVPGLATGSTVTGESGGYRILVPSPDNLGSTIAVADVPLPPLPARYVGEDKQIHVSLVPSTFSARSQLVGIGGRPLATGDILVDARALTGQVTFVDRTGKALPENCGTTIRLENGEITQIKPADVATTEVHFFREEDLQHSIAKFSAVAPAACGGDATGTYARVRIGPADANKQLRLASCARMAKDPAARMTDAYQLECSDDQGRARNFLRLRTNDHLVIFATNHATGYSGLTRVTVPSVSRSTVGSNGQCPADKDGLVHVQEGTFSYTVSHCTFQDLAIRGDLRLYPPEIEMRVRRHAPEDGAKRRASDPEETAHLVRTGGSATAKDDYVNVITRWRVRATCDGGSCDAADAGPAAVDAGLDAGSVAACGKYVQPDGGVVYGAAPDGGYCDPSAIVDDPAFGDPDGGERVPLYCAELPPGADKNECLKDDRALTDVPTGVPPLAGRLWSKTGKIAAGEPPPIFFPVQPGLRSVLLNVSTSFIDKSAPDAGIAQTLGNLQPAVYFLHVVGNPLGPRDTNGDGVIQPAEEVAAAKANPAVPDFHDDPAVQPGLPLNAVQLHDVFRGYEKSAVLREKFDRSRELEFSVVDYDLAGRRIWAVTGTGDAGMPNPVPGGWQMPDGGIGAGVRVLADDTTDFVDPRPQAGFEDNSYQILLSLLEPVGSADPRRAPSLGDYHFRFGGDVDGADCRLQIQDGPVVGGIAVRNLWADCGGEALQEIASAQDLLYIELFKAGNAENALYRFNFDGLTPKRTYLFAGSYFTALKDPQKDTVAADLTATSPDWRPVSTPSAAILNLTPAELTSGNVKLCVGSKCKAVLASYKFTFDAAKNAYDISFSTPPAGQAPLPVLSAPFLLPRQGADPFTYTLSLPTYVAVPQAAQVDPNVALGEFANDTVWARFEPDGKVPISRRLGQPKEFMQGEHSESIGQQEIEGVNLADGHLTRSYTDFAVPFGESRLEFGRIYNNQNNAIGPIGNGWTHTLQGEVVEERAGRYAVLLRGQSYEFYCDTVSRDPSTHEPTNVAGCRTNKTHGHTLDVVWGKDPYFVVVEVGSGTRYIFDRPGKLNGGEGQRRWLLRAVDDLRATLWLSYKTGEDVLEQADFQDPPPAGTEWPHVADYKLTALPKWKNRLRMKFVYAGAPGQDPPGTHVSAQLRRLVRHGEQLLQSVSAVVVDGTTGAESVTALAQVSFEHDKTYCAGARTPSPLMVGNLTRADVQYFGYTDAQTWVYGYLAQSAGSPGEVWAGRNELEHVFELRKELDRELVQAHWRYGRDPNDTAKGRFSHVRQNESVTQIYAPGQGTVSPALLPDPAATPAAFCQSDSYPWEQKIVRIEYSSAQAGLVHRTVHLPGKKPEGADEVKVEIDLNQFGSVVATSAADLQTALTWKNGNAADAGIVRPDTSTLPGGSQINFSSDTSSLLTTKVSSPAFGRPLVDKPLIGFNDRTRSFTTSTLLADPGTQSTRTLVQQPDPATGLVTQVTSNGTTLASATVDPDKHSYTSAQQPTTSVVSVREWNDLGWPKALTITAPGGTAAPPTPAGAASLCDQPPSAGALNSVTICMEYDSIGRMTRRRELETGRSQSQTYDAWGRLTREELNGRAWDHVYTMVASGMVKRVDRLQGLPRITEWMVDTLPVRTQQPYNVSASCLGPGPQTDPACGDLVLTNFERTYAGGQLDFEQRDPAHWTRTSIYDAAGRLIRLEDQDKNPVRKIGYLSGRVDSVTDELGTTVLVSYDALNRPNKWTYLANDAGEVESVVREGATSLIVQRKQGSHTVKYGRDEVGRVTLLSSDNMPQWQETFGGFKASGLYGSHDDVGIHEEFDYGDPLGRMTSRKRVLASGAAQTETWTYFGGQQVPPVQDCTGPTVGSSGASSAGQTIVHTTRLSGLGLRCAYEVQWLDGFGRVRKIFSAVDGIMRTETFEYDDYDNVTVRRLEAGAVSDSSAPPLPGTPLPIQVTSTYGASGELLRTEEQGEATVDAGARTTYVYDTVGRRRFQTGPRPEENWSFGYDNSGRLSSRTLAATSQVLEAAPWTYDYSTPGKVTEKPPGAASAPITRTLDGKHRPIHEERTTADGKQVIDRTYDGDQVFTEKITEGTWISEKTFTYKDRGWPDSSIEKWTAPGATPYEYRTAHGWDGLTDTVTETWGLPTDKTSIVAYDALGNRLSFQQAGRLRTWLRDATGAVLTESVPERLNRTFTYDAAGPLKTVALGTETTTYHYRFDGKTVGVDDPSGRTFTMDYSPRGLLKSSTVALSPQDSYSVAYSYLDGTDQPTTITYAPGTGDSSTWKYLHGPLGEIARVTTGASNDILYRYFPDRSLKSITGAGGTQVFSYDGRGRILHRERGSRLWNTAWQDGESTTADGEGGLKLVLYDGRGRVARQKFQGIGTGLQQVDLSYHGLDQPTSVVETFAGSGLPISTAYLYDDAYRLLRITRGDTPVVLYSYTGFDAPNRVETQPGGAVTYTYDPRGYLSGAIGPANSFNLTVNWLPGGQYLDSVSGGSLFEQWDYRAAGWVKSVTISGVVGSTSYAYDYDRRGNRKSQDQQGDLTTYGYDLDEHLTGVKYPDGHATLYQVRPSGTREAEWDIPGYQGPLSNFGPPAGGAATRYWQYGLDSSEALTGITNALTGASSVATTDLAGRLKQLQLPGQPLQTFEWDTAGRLVAASIPSGSGTQRTEYSYDWRNWRVAATTSQLPAPPATPSVVHSQQFAWGADGVVAETLGNGSWATYTHAAGMVAAVGGQRLAHDALGSVVGRIVAGSLRTSGIDAWGNYTSGTPQPGEPTPGFAGQTWDPDARLSYAQQRWYAPGVGRFLSEDPLEVTPERLLSVRQLDGFAYAGANPLRYIDPSGLDFADTLEGCVKSLGHEVLLAPLDKWSAIDRYNNPDLTGGYEACDLTKQVPRAVNKVGNVLHRSSAGTTTREFWTATPARQAVVGCALGAGEAVIPLGPLGGEQPEALSYNFDRCEFAVGAAIFVEAGYGALENLKPPPQVRGPRTPAPASASAKARRLVREGTLIGESKAADSLSTSLMRDGEAQAGGGNAATSSKQTRAKRGPKTDPNAPHNAKIRSEADKLEAEGNRIVAGGGRQKEALVPTPGGIKSGRRPDIIYETPQGQRRARNVGLSKADGTPVTREVEALKDLNEKGGLPTDFVPYDQ